MLYKATFTMGSPKVEEVIGYRGDDGVMRIAECGPYCRKLGSGETAVLNGSAYGETAKAAMQRLAKEYADEVLVKRMELKTLTEIADTIRKAANAA